MISTILLKEIRESITGLKFIIALALCVVLISSSALIRTRHFNTLQSNYRTNLELHIKVASNNNAYRDLQTNGFKVDRKPNPLSIFVEGIENSVPGIVIVSGNSGLVNDDQTGGNPYSDIFGKLDFLFVIQIVMSLVAVLFSYNALCGEREQGTLVLAMSNPVPASNMIFGKIIGGFTGVSIPFVISYLIGIFIVFTMGDLNFSEAAGPAVFIFFAAMLYVFLFLNLGVFISSRFRNSSASLIFLLFLWVCFSFLIPNISVIISKYIKPVPSKEEILEQKRHAANPEWGRFMERYDEYQEEYNAVPLFNVAQEWIIERDDKISAGFDRIEQDYFNKLNMQVKFAGFISRLSPASSLYFTLSGIAGTGIPAYMDRLDRLRLYKTRFVEYTKKMIHEKDTPIPNPMATIEISDMPRFQPAEYSFPDSLKSVSFDIIYLLILCGGFYLLAFYSFIKMDIRQG